MLRQGCASVCRSVHRSILLLSAVSHYSSTENGRGGGATPICTTPTNPTQPHTCFQSSSQYPMGMRTCVMPKLAIWSTSASVTKVSQCDCKRGSSTMQLCLHSPPQTSPDKSDPALTVGRRIRVSQYRSSPMPKALLPMLGWGKREAGWGGGGGSVLRYPNTYGSK